MEEKLKHSKLGVASFVTSLVSGMGLVFVFIIAGILGASGSMHESSMQAVITGLLIILFIGTDIVALGLGIAGLLQKNVNKLYAILGLAFSAVVVLGIIAVILIGFSMLR